MSEYAPEYTTKERVIFLAKHLAWAIPLVAATQFWFFPWFEEYAENAHCYDYGSFTGTHVVFYFVFVAIPIGSALTIFAIEGARSIKVLKLGQSPLPGEKVFSRTKYKYDLKATLAPCALLLTLVFLVGLGIRGIFWANEIIYNASNSPPPPCASGDENHERTR